MFFGRQFFFFTVLFALTVSYAGAQEAELEAPDPDAPDYGPLETPRRSADGFTAAIESGDYELAADFLDMRYLKGEAATLDGADLARRLSVVIQRAEWIEVDELVDAPSGRTNDNLPEYRDSFGTVAQGGRQVIWTSLLAVAPG